MIGFSPLLCIIEKKIESKTKLLSPFFSPQTLPQVTLSLYDKIRVKCGKVNQWKKHLLYHSLSLSLFTIPHTKQT